MLRLMCSSCPESRWGSAFVYFVFYKYGCFRSYFTHKEVPFNNLKLRTALNMTPTYMNMNNTAVPLGR